MNENMTWWRSDNVGRQIREVAGSTPSRSTATYANNPRQLVHTHVTW